VFSHSSPQSSEGHTGRLSLYTKSAEKQSKRENGNLKILSAGFPGAYDFFGGSGIKPLVRA
jgi:hypothetical protein